MSEARASWGARALAFGFGPSSGLRLEAFRWCLTLALLVYTLTWSLDASEWLTTAGYHVSPEASRGLQLPVPQLPSWALAPFLVVYFGSMVAVLFGLRPRLFSWLVFAGLLYVTTADRLAAFSMNKLALVAWLVILLAPWDDGEEDGAAKQADEQSGEAEREPRLRSRWPLWVLQTTLILQYFGAGICKLRGDWLESGRVLWLQAQSIYMTELSAWMVRELPMGLWAGLQHGALAFELLAPLLFCVPKLRPVTFVWGVLMHLAIALMMYRVGLFSLSVVAYYVLFFDEAWLRALRRRLR